MTRLQPPPTGRPIRRSRTRKSLIEGGKRLIANGLMQSATIDDIVREADVAKGSFYNHFTDRDALIECVLGTVMDELQTSIANAVEGIDDMATSLAVGVLASFRYGLNNHLGARVLLYINAEVANPKSPRNERLIRRLQAGIDSGAFKLPNLDAGVIQVIGISDLGLARLLELRDDPHRSREVIRGACVVLLRGLGVPAPKVEGIVEKAIEIMS